MTELAGIKKQHQPRIVIYLNRLHRHEGVAFLLLADFGDFGHQFGDFFFDRRHERRIPARLFLQKRRVKGRRSAITRRHFVAEIGILDGKRFGQAFVSFHGATIFVTL